MLRPDIGQRFAPNLHANLPVRCDRASGKTPLGKEELRVRRELLQPKRRFPLADFDVGLGKLVPVNENVRAGKLRPVGVGHRGGLAGFDVDFTQSGDSRIALLKVTFDLEVELLQEIAGETDARAS